MIIRNSGKINGRSVIYCHHIKFYEQYGYDAKRVGIDANGDPYDMDNPRQIPGVGVENSVLDAIRPCGKINSKSVIYRAYLTFYQTHGYVPDRIGRVDGDISNDAVANLYDMSFGKPIVNIAPVKNDPLWKIVENADGITDRERAYIQRPLPEDVRSDVLDFFRIHGDFVPMGDVVIDKSTGGVKIRRFIVERMVQDDELWYDGSCYKLTFPAT